MSRGTPRFEGHEQPKVPGELGFYDLRLRTTFSEQITLAQAHGIMGFCLYHYRFGTQRQLDLPLRSLLSSPQPNFPFCLCWANESWTKAWDGRSDKVLLEQTYGEETLSGLVEDLTGAMQDPRYIRVDDRPVFMIYQLEHLPAPQSEWIADLRQRLKKATGIEMCLGGVYSHGFTPAMSKLVDFVVQFPPHRIPRPYKRKLVSPDKVALLPAGKTDYFEDYDDVARASLDGIDLVENLVPGVCPDWDNSSRRQEKAHILLNSAPDKFGIWASLAAKESRRKAAAGLIPAPFLFINAWNEWAEGAVLEPSWKHQRKYLEALRSALKSK